MQYAKNYVYNQLRISYAQYPLIDPVTRTIIPDHLSMEQKIYLVDNHGKPINCDILISNTIRLIQQYQITPNPFLFSAMDRNVALVAGFCTR